MDAIFAKERVLRQTQKCILTNGSTLLGTGSAALSRTTFPGGYAMLRVIRRSPDSDRG